MASLVVTVATNALGDSMFVPALTVLCKRRNVSCTTSSASATLPSMRYAIEKLNERRLESKLSSFLYCHTTAGCSVWISEKEHRNENFCRRSGGRRRETFNPPIAGERS